MASTSNTAAKTILLVDDQDDYRLTTKWLLSSFGYQVDTARSAEEALLRFNRDLHDLVVTDNAMPGMTGFELAHLIKLRSPRTLVLMYTGHPPGDPGCIDRVLARPIHVLELKEAIDTLLAEG